MLWLLSGWGKFALVEKGIQTKNWDTIWKFYSSISDEIKYAFGKGARLFDTTFNDKSILKLLGLSMQ